VPAQPAGLGFGLAAGSLPVLGSAELSWTGGTQQTGDLVLRYALDSGTIAPLPADGSLLPAPAQSFQDTAALPEQLYCYQLVPWNDAGAVGVSDELCLYPRTRSATGAPPTFTVRLNQGHTASLSWSASGGQDGYLLVGQAIGGEPRLQLLGANQTSATDDTLGLATCYQLLPMVAGAPVGNSDTLCAVPGQATVGASQPAALQGLTPNALASRARTAADALKRPEAPTPTRIGR
jgi:hypothetical protein